MKYSDKNSDLIKFSDINPDLKTGSTLHNNKSGAKQSTQKLIESTSKIVADRIKHRSAKSIRPKYKFLIWKHQNNPDKLPAKRQAFATSFFFRKHFY